MTAGDLAAWTSALTQIERDGRAERWRNDPVLWVRERLGEHPWSKQADILRSVAENPLTAVQSGHGVGKSWVASRLIAWAIETSEPGTTFCVTTATNWAQVKVVLWRYLGQLHAQHGLRGIVNQNCEWKIGPEIVAFGRKPADHDDSGFQGVHAERVVVVIDEAGGVPTQLWHAVDSLVTTDASRVLAIGNPTSVSSHFHKVCTTEPGWKRLRISALDSPNFTNEQIPDSAAAGLVSQAWVTDKALRWGADSALYQVKVEGQFADDDENALIPATWIYEAWKRWDTWNDNPLRDSHQPPGRRIFGVDVGHLGEDRTVIATRQGHVIMSVEAWSKRDTVAVTGLIEARLDAAVQGLAVVDGIGIGAGCVDLLRAHGKNVQPFIASAGTKRRDSTGTQGFPNVRSASWWHLRECLDPALGATLALPPDEALLEDLTTPRWEPVTGGKIRIEAKDDIRKRLGRSTDYGDAVAMAMWVDAVQRDRPDGPRLRPVPYIDTQNWS